MNWLLFALLGTLFASITTILQRAFLKEEQSNHYAYAIVFPLLVSLWIFIYALFAGFTIPDFRNLSFNWVLLIILYALGNVSVYRGMQLIEASQKTILFSSKAIWAMLSAIIFLGEKISYLRIVGVLLIILSTIIISWKGKSFKFSKGHFYILMSAILFGAAFTNDAFILKTTDTASFSVLAFSIPAIILLLARPKTIKELKFFTDKRRLLKILGASFFYAISAVVIYVSYKVGGDVSQIVPVSQLAIIMTVILAYMFLKEKENLLRKLVGAVLALAGVLLII